MRTFRRLLFWQNDIPPPPLTQPNPTPYRKPVCIVTLSDKQLTVILSALVETTGWQKQIKFYYPCGDIWPHSVALTNEHTQQTTNPYTPVDAQIRIIWLNSFIVCCKMTLNTPVLLIAITHGFIYHSASNNYHGFKIK